MSKLPNNPGRLVPRAAFACSLAAVFAVAAFAAAAPSPATKPANKPLTERDYREKYGAIADQNIFLKDHGKRPTVSRPVAQTRFVPPPLTAEERYVLSGITVLDGEMRAYFENREGGQVVPTVIGSTIAFGKIAGITFEAVDYESKGKHTWIEVGSNLTGKYVMALSSPSVNSGSSGGPTTVPTNSSGGTDLKALEEKLKQQNKQYHPNP